MATSVQPVPAGKTAIQEETAFIDSMVKKFEGRDAAASAGDGGRKTKDEEPAPKEKPAASVKSEDTSNAETGDGQGTGEAAAGESDGTETELEPQQKSGPEETGDGEGQAAEGEEDGAGEAGETQEGEGEGAEAAGPKVGADGLTDATREALTKHGLKLKLEDVPAQYRPIVERKLTEVNQAFTRAQMENTNFRKELRDFHADRAFFYENIELALADALVNKRDGSPRTPEERDKLENEVAKLLEKTTTDDGRRLLATDVKEARGKAVTTIDSATQAYDRQVERAESMIAYTQRACDKLDLPFEIVAQAIGLETRRKEDGGMREPFLTDAEMDVVIDQQARILRRRDGNVKRGERQQQIKTQTRDRKTSSPAARISGSAAPAPKGETAPKNDQEFIERMERKHSAAAGAR